MWEQYFKTPPDITLDFTCYKVPMKSLKLVMDSNRQEGWLNEYPGMALWKCWSIMDIKGVDAKARPKETEVEW